MPKSIEKHIAKDVLETFDPDIQAVRFNNQNNDLIIMIEPETKYLYLNEQDLVNLLTFLRKEKQQ
jgi:hypothetical protein